MHSALPLQKALATNSTSTDFTAQTPTATEPTGVGVFDLLARPYGHSVYVPSWLQIIPFGTDGNDDTFDFRVYGYSKTTDATPLYIPQLLIDVSVVLGNIAATAIAANTFMADTLTINDGPIDGLFRSHIDCQEDMGASLLIHTRGCRYIKFDWDLSGAQAAASMNAYWRSIE